MSQSTWEMMSPADRQACTDAGRSPSDSIVASAFDELHGTQTGRIPARAELDEERGKGDSEDENHPLDPDGDGVEDEEDDEDLDDFMDDEDEVEAELDDDEDEDDSGK
jgi:hypothetical protein